MTEKSDLTVSEAINEFYRLKNKYEQITLINILNKLLIVKKVIEKKVWIILNYQKMSV